MKLRALEPEDADMLYLAENDCENFARGDAASLYSRHQLLTYALCCDSDPFKTGQLRLVATADDDTPLGLLDFYDIKPRDRNAFVGLAVLPHLRGMGYGSGLLLAALDYAPRILGLASLAAFVHSDNEPSLAIFRKCGFDDVGILRKWHFSDGTLKDVHVFQFLFNRWRS